MSEFNPKKIDTSIINSGRKYEQGDGVQPNLFNDIVEGVAYVDEEMQALTEQPDTSEASLVGEPTVTLVNTVYNGRTHKKFKFSRLKGEQGEQGEIGETGLSALVYNGQMISNTVLEVDSLKAISQSKFSRSPIVGDFTTFTLLVNDTDLYNVVAEITEINLPRDVCQATIRYINKLNANLPSVTTADEGKFLRVNASGVWVAEEVPSAEGGEF